MIVWIVEALCSLGGLWTWHWLMKLGDPAPFRYEPLKVPTLADGRMTSDSDFAGLY